MRPQDTPTTRKLARQELVLLGLVALGLSHGFLPRVTPSLPPRSRPSLTPLTPKALSDPGGEFVARPNPPSPSRINSTGPSTGRVKMPPMKETMALLFSPDKRQGMSHINVPMQRNTL